MKITWLGHSAFRVETRACVILFDPFLTGNPKFAGSFDEATRGATHILLTHGHDDHIGDAARIAKETGAQIVANYEICMCLAEQGAADINPGNTGGTVPCGDFTVSFTPAWHSSGTLRDGASVYLGNPNGLVVACENGPTLYHMGDTALFGDMALIAELYRPQIGIVPVGGRFTMDGAQAALAVKRYFRFETVIPCHYGTFDAIAPDPSAFVAAMQGSGVDVRVLGVGESMAV
ncbi:MAG: metal-dependent hydrolase [Methylocystis sp.]|nr:metal-dependent hydrolase [Methylocystis sp.]